MQKSSAILLMLFSAHTENFIFIDKWALVRFL